MTDDPVPPDRDTPADSPARDPAPAGLRPDERQSRAEGGGPDAGRPPPGRAGRGALVAGAVGGALAWILTPDLPTAARVWTAVLLAPLPAALSGQHHLVTDPESLPRIPVYTSSIISLWALALITTLVSRASGYGSAELGLVISGAPATAAWAAAATAAGMAVVFAAHALDIGTTALLEGVIPRTTHEKSVFAGLSITAGVCEELVFRGFLILTLTAASGSILAAALISTVVFGWMHTYQGVQGAAGAALLGGILAVPVLFTGSILPSIIAHAAIDILAGIIFAPKLYGRMA